MYTGLRRAVIIAGRLRCQLHIDTYRAITRTRYDNGDLRSCIKWHVVVEVMNSWPNHPLYHSMTCRPSPPLPLSRTSRKWLLLDHNNLGVHSTLLSVNRDVFLLFIHHHTSTLSISWYLSDITVYAASALILTCTARDVSRLQYLVWVWIM